MPTPIREPTWINIAISATGITNRKRMNVMKTRVSHLEETSSITGWPTRRIRGREGGAFATMNKISSVPSYGRRRNAGHTNETTELPAGPDNLSRCRGGGTYRPGTGLRTSRGLCQHSAHRQVDLFMERPGRVNRRAITDHQIHDTRLSCYSKKDSRTAPL